MTTPLQIQTIVSQPFEENSYVVWLPKHKEAIVIDPGLEPHLILDFIREQGLERFSVHPEVREGTPFAEIVRCARDKDIDLIVMGTHGHTGLAHMLLGSVTEKVVRKAPCPVLTVRHPEHEFVHP